MQHKAYYNDIDPYCCRVLEKQIRLGNLPPGDVDGRSITDVDPAELRSYTQIHLFAGIGGIPHGLRLAGVPDSLNIITGGFPCQDISNAGQRVGITGTRSGLWRCYAEFIRQLRPRYVLVENVSALLARGVDRVLGDLAACGYDAEWDCIPACAVGAPHERDRLWIVAYPNGQRCQKQHASSITGEACRDSRHASPPVLADTDIKQWQKGRQRGRVACPQESNRERDLYYWQHQSEPVRVAHGIPHRMDRIRGLGNAVVPQCVAVIGAAIRRHAGV